MALRFKCSTCKKWHEGIPDIGYDSPYYAHELPEDERSKRVHLTSDLCTLDDRHFFVRCMLFLPIIGTQERFGLGVWSTLSEANFNRYRDHRHRDISDWEPMFGYLSNCLPNYPDTLGLRLSVQPGTAGARPSVTLEPSDHPLSIDQRDGIALDKVMGLIEPYLHE